MSYWREDTWQQGPWSTTRATCTNCGWRFEYFQTPNLANMKLRVRLAHEQICWDPPTLCQAVSREGKPCTLRSGHPTGEQFDWFTDQNGHIWEK